MGHELSRNLPAKSLTLKSRSCPKARVPDGVAGMTQLLRAASLQLQCARVLRTPPQPGAALAAGLLGGVRRHLCLPGLLVRETRPLSPRPLAAHALLRADALCALPRAASQYRALRIRALSSFTAPQAEAPAEGAGAEAVAEAGTDTRGEEGRVEEVQGEQRAGERAMGWWLIGCSGLVAGMVVLGGVTRLTGSGLSMVKWRPTGIWPPTTAEGWEAEFEEFKLYPEWQMKRQYEGFTVEDFKFIWYMEWSHRMADNIGMSA